MKSSKLLQITIPLEDILELELECTYYYEPPVKGDDINPSEQAVVSLERVYLGLAQLEVGVHLSVDRWERLEQEIYDRIEQGY